jgi:hypothetical protein
VMSNAGPDSGLQLNEAVVRWVMEHYLGVVERDPEPLPYDAEQAQRQSRRRSGSCSRIVARSLQRTGHRCDGQLEGVGGLRRRPAEDVAQDEHRPLPRRQVLDGDDERQLDRLPRHRRFLPSILPPM